MTKIEYDFLTWKSLPSSLKFINDRPYYIRHKLITLRVTPGAKLTAETQVKGENMMPTPTLSGAVVGTGLPDILRFPLGTFGWTKIIREDKPDERKWPITIPDELTSTDLSIASGTGTAWIDDLKIYQNGVLIYENKFSNWGPFTGILAPVVTGLGIVRFGKKG